MSLTDKTTSLPSTSLSTSQGRNQKIKGPLGSQSQHDSVIGGENVVTEEGSAKGSAIQPMKKVVAFIEQFLKLLNDTNGRDKVTKFLQYGTKVVNYQIETHPTLVQDPKYWLDYTNRFEGSLVTARKVFRFFKFLPGYLALIKFFQKYVHVKNAAMASKNMSNWTMWMDVLDLLNKLFMSHYFLFDHLSWASKLQLFSSIPLTATSKALLSGSQFDSKLASNRFSLLFKHLLNNERMAQFSKYGNTCWFYGLVVAIIIDGIKLCQDFEREYAALKEFSQIVTTNAVSKVATDQEGDEKLERSMYLGREIEKIRKQRQKLFLAFLRNFCDLGVSSSLSGWWNASKQTVGIMGVVAALIGIYELW